MLLLRAPICAAHDALQNRDRPELRARTGPSSAGPGSAAHRFAHARSEFVQALVHALALRRIRDTMHCSGIIMAHS
jgi:hypothetical protein